MVCLDRFKSFELLSPEVPIISYHAMRNTVYGIVKLRSFEQNLDNTGIQSALIFQHPCYRAEVENLPSLL